MKTVRDWMRFHAGERIKPRIPLADGTDISVQGSSGHYCTPRVDWQQDYTTVEVGFPENIAYFHEWAERCNGDYSGVAGWVPIEVVEEYVRERGGIKQ